MFDISDAVELTDKRFEPFKPHEVIIEYDILSFVLKVNSELYFVHWLDEQLVFNDKPITEKYLDRIVFNESFDRYAVVPISSESLEDLKNNKLTLFDALNQKDCYLVDAYRGNRGNGLIKTYKIDFNLIPEDCLPCKNCFLNPLKGD